MANTNRGTSAPWSVLRDRLKRYESVSQAREWLDRNYDKVSKLFSDQRLRDFVFEPFRGVFVAPTKSIDANVYSVITQVAIINAVLAGLPGRMGVGVFVSMALEGWMAYRIAKHIGIRVETPADIWKYFGMLAATAATILYLFRILLGLGFSLFSLVPGVNPLIFAEILVTDLVGVLFWIGFQEVREDRPFSIPRRTLLLARSRTWGIFMHQYGILKNVVSPENIRKVSDRVRVYLKGEFPVDMRLVNGEVFATAAMAYLISGHFEKLEGPLGETFLKAIRLRWSSQFNEETSVSEIAERFHEYDSDELRGAVNTIKGKMFELLVEQQENLDDARWSARLHSDESFPGSDIVFVDEATGQQVDVSLKAVSADQAGIIEAALARYPETPILTTDEVAAIFGANEMVSGSSISNEDLRDITEDRLDELLTKIEPINENEVIFGGVTVGTTAALWPFTVAYLRGRITQEQLQKVFTHILGQSGLKLASRIAYGAVLGPLFAWYLLARGVKGIVVLAEPSVGRRIEFVRRAPVRRVATTTG